MGHSYPSIQAKKHTNCELRNQILSFYLAEHLAANQKIPHTRTDIRDLIDSPHNIFYVTNHKKFLISVISRVFD